MKFSEIVSFRKDLFFDGAVQIDWFLQPEKGRKVAENYVFHGSEYYGVSEENSGRSLTDTIRFTHDICQKAAEDEQRINPLTLAVSGYGTGKSHLAVTLSQLLSGGEYMPETRRSILSNIGSIDQKAAAAIREYTQRPNLVLVLNGMRDFNLHYELLRAAQRALRLYSCSDENLKKLNRAIETASRFFERNANTSPELFERFALQFGYRETGDALLKRIRTCLNEDTAAFNIVNAAYEEINGNEIRWDEGVSASAVLETLLVEYCGVSGQFDRIIILFDEFGRYLEYASSATSAQSGDSALQQMFESAQNAEGRIQIVSFIQSDIKSYLQRVDQTSNISRYIGRYDASDKYYLSSNLETIFANLIQRKDRTAFETIVRRALNAKESDWRKLFENMQRWLPVMGLWKEYKLFRKVAVEGIYPLHPISTYMLSRLSDYLQNRSSLMLVSRYIEQLSDVELTADGEIPIIFPESILKGDLFTEMLTAEEEGRQMSQHCIRLHNINKKLQDKLSENAQRVLRANLALRILRFRTEDYEDAKSALALCSGLPVSEVERELHWLEDEYAVLGFDVYAGCFDFLEDSSGAHDFRTFFKRVRAASRFSLSVLESSEVRNLAGVLAPQSTNYGINHHILTNEWQFEQDMFSIDELSEAMVKSYVSAWRSATSPDKLRGRMVWLYLNRDSDPASLEQAQRLSAHLEDKPILLMLLNDADDRLKNALWDYSVLQSVEEADRKKYGRHYEDALSQSMENIRAAFDTLRKQRCRILTDGAAPLEKRLAVALTDIFERIYPKQTSFDFDGFGSKQPAKARKAFCSITRLLLTGSVSDNTIHSFPSDIRNRFGATLHCSGAFSWKCVNDSYQIMPPEAKKARDIYDFIVEQLKEGEAVSFKTMYEELVAPPYGLNDYSVFYMMAVVCANLNFCLRIVYNDEVYTIQNWCPLVVTDNKIDLARFLKSDIKRINAGAVNEQFLRLFQRIEGNRNVMLVAQLSQELQSLKKAEDLPVELSAAYQLSLNKLQEGQRLINQWKNTFDAQMDIYDRFLLNLGDIYLGLKALDGLEGPACYSCFAGSSYDIPEEFQRELRAAIVKVRTLLKKELPGWIRIQRCKAIENLASFRNHMMRVQKMLMDLGFRAEADAVEKKMQREIANKERIKARQDLLKEITSFQASCVPTASTPYTRLLDWEKRAEAILKGLEQCGDMLEGTLESYQDSILSRMNEIEEYSNRIKDAMNQIWTDLYEISDLSHIKKLVGDIQAVSGKGIPENDWADFNEMKNTLEGFLHNVDSLTECGNDRGAFDSERKRVLSLYQEQELEFDVSSILEEVIAGIERQFAEKDRTWRARYLDHVPTERQAMLRWRDNVMNTPNYLSEETRNLLQTRRTEVKARLGNAMIDDVVYSFSRLEKEQMGVCMERLEEVYQQKVFE